MSFTHDASYPHVHLVPPSGHLPDRHHRPRLSPKGAPRHLRLRRTHRLIPLLKHRAQFARPFFGKPSAWARGAQKSAQSSQGVDTHPVQRGKSAGKRVGGPSGHEEGGAFVGRTGDVVYWWLVLSPRRYFPSLAYLCGSVR